MYVMTQHPRNAIFQMRIAAAERDMLQDLADRDGISASDVVRIFIRREHAKAFGDRPAKRAAARRSR
jgi:hypothetical protein